MSIPTVFLDKDGTLVKDIPFNVDLNQIVFAKETLEHLKRISKTYRFIVVTNQGGIAQGKLTENDIVRVADYLKSIFSSQGLHLLDFYYCPHHPQGCIPAYTGDCNCRKPKPGLLLKAQKDHDIDLSASWFIGDILDDIECAHAAGCRGILLDNGGETLWQVNAMRSPDALVKNFKEAVDVITTSPYHHTQKWIEDYAKDTMRAFRQSRRCDHDDASD